MATEETERQLDHLRGQKGVKVVFVLNWQGELITTSVNDKTLDEAVIDKYHKLAYQVSVGLRTAVKGFDDNETLQYGRVRMKDNELVLVPEEKFLLAVIQDPNVN